MGRKSGIANGLHKKGHADTGFTVSLHISTTSTEFHYREENRIMDMDILVSQLRRAGTFTEESMIRLCWDAQKEITRMRGELLLRDKIATQVYRAVEKLSPSSVELLCVLGSIGDSLSDTDVLECLEQYNEHGTYKAEILFDVNDTPQNRRNRIKLLR